MCLVSRLLLWPVASAALTSSCIAQSPAVSPQNCIEAQEQYDSIKIASTYDPGSSWTLIQARFGAPLQVEENKPYESQTLLRYAYPGCSISFAISNGKVYTKTYSLGAAAIAPPAPISGLPADQPTSSEISATITSLQATMNLLQRQVEQLQRAIQELKASTRTTSPNNPGITQSPVPTSVASTSPAASALVPSDAPDAPPVVSPATGGNPLCAENGNC